MAISLKRQNNLMNFLYTIRHKKVPGQLVIQFTDRCNGSCPQCGMRVTEQFQRSTLSVDDVKRILDTAAQRGVKVVSFTGGEPLLYLEQLSQYIKYAGNAGIEFIRTGTNGFVFMNSESPLFRSKVERVAETLAETPLRNFWISIDSAVPTVHEKMRGFPGVMRGIEKALPIFHRYGIYPSANLGINRNVGGEKTANLHPEDSKREGLRPWYFYKAFREAFTEFYGFIIDMGFTMVNSCYPMSVEDQSSGADLSAVYGATSRDRLIRFNHREKRLLFLALLEVLPEFRSRIRIFSPRCTLYVLQKRYQNGRNMISHPCRGGMDYFFIDAREGNTYPCGYRGRENLGKYWSMIAHGAGDEEPCFRCDWECFRDPSELFGPLVEGSTNRIALINHLKEDAQFYRLWIGDIMYHLACGFFDGREPPDYGRLRVFSRLGARLL